MYFWRLLRVTADSDIGDINVFFVFRSMCSPNLEGFTIVPTEVTRDRAGLVYIPLSLSSPSVRSSMSYTNTVNSALSCTRQRSLRAHLTAVTTLRVKLERFCDESAMYNIIELLKVQNILCSLSRSAK